jgi:hypothetical protein
MKYSHILTLTACVAMFAGCARWHANYGASEQISFNQLPRAAQATVRNEVGNQPISLITKEYKYGETSYRIEVEHKGLNPTLWVAQDGSIIKESRGLYLSSRQPVYQPSVQVNEAAGAQSSTSVKPMPMPRGKQSSDY